MLRQFEPRHPQSVYKALGWDGLMGSGQLNATTGLPPNPTVVWRSLSKA